MSEKGKESSPKVRKDSENEIKEEKKGPAHIPKNPIVRPADVKISDIMKQLMANDKG